MIRLKSEEIAEKKTNTHIFYQAVDIHFSVFKNKEIVCGIGIVVEVNIASARNARWENEKKVQTPPGPPRMSID